MKKLRNLFLIFVIGVIAGYLLLVLAYALPKGRMWAHVADQHTFDVMGAERNYPKLIANHEDSRLDNFTDAIMLKMASSDDEHNPFVQALLNPRESSNGGEASAEDVMCMYLGEAPYITYYYYRYWHGYLIFLKPLLMFLSYDEIRYVLMTVDIGLFAIALYLMGRRKKEEFVIPFIISTLVLNIPAVCLSMQYNACYLLTMASVVAILWFDTWFEQKDKWPYFFLVTGMLTSYLDFLTYPPYVFALPMAMLLFMYGKDIKDNAKNFLVNGVCWSVGYLAFWAMKWIMAQVVTGEPVIQNALDEILFRTSDEWFEGGSISFGGTMAAVWYTQNYYVYLAIVFAIAASIYFIIKKYKPNWTGMITMVVIGLVPIAWYYLTKNHSCMHTYMTYRQMSILVFAIAMLGTCWTKKSGGNKVGSD